MLEMNLTFPNLVLFQCFVFIRVSEIKIVNNERPLF